LKPIDRPSLRRGGVDELAIDARRLVNLHDQLSHRCGCIAGKSFESIEHFTSKDFFTRPRDQPVIQKDRRSRMPNAPDSHFGLPEGGLELLPVVLVRALDISAQLEQALKYEVLD
jgi:hypothetical protein